MKTADFSRKSSPAPASLLTAAVRKSFLFLVARMHRSRAAAFAAAFMALIFARRLMTPATRPQAQDTAPTGRVFDGEYRRIHEPR
ncbi:MAG TPA: hypothetical protein VGK09_14485 [Rhodocyclaceae bacterium]|jgi:hypothetical protein